MKLKQFFGIIACILLFASLTHAQNEKNIILNGSFEENYETGKYKNLKNGEKFPGWKVVREDIDINGPYFKAVDGIQSIDLNGYNSGAIEQRFFTDKGKKYLVTFYLAGNLAGPPQVKKLMVSAGTQYKTFEFNTQGKTNQAPGWIYCEFIFKAEERATVLRFESDQGPESTAYGPLIDLVSVSRTNKKATKAAKLEKKEKVEKRKETKTFREPFFNFNYGLLGGSSYYLLFKDTPFLVDYNTSKYDLAATKANFGIHFGGFAALSAGPVLLRPELRFNSNRIEYTLSGASVQTAMERYQSMEIPLLLGYEYNSFKILLGPSINIFLGRQSTLKDLGDFSSAMKTFSFAYEFGGGYQYRNVMLDLRFAGNMRTLGDGFMINTTKYYFTDMPPRIVATLTFEI